MNICVYSSSSDALAKEYYADAEILGALIAQRGHSLIFGGCRLGLMGAVAHAVHQHGGQVVGIIPESIHGRGLAYVAADEMIVTSTMHERKALMEEKADAFVALPGGFGTLEETLQVITLKQLQYHTKPIVMINTNRFYDPLLSFFQHTYDQKFAKPIYRDLYHVSEDPAGVLDYLDQYKAPEIQPKWFGTKV